MCRQLHFSGRSCKYDRYARATVPDKYCTGIKQLRGKYEGPPPYFEKCKNAACQDPDCGTMWFIHPVGGRCLCLKKGHGCNYVAGDATQYKFLQYPNL